MIFKILILVVMMDKCVVLKYKLFLWLHWPFYKTSKEEYHLAQTERKSKLAKNKKPK